MVRHQMFQPGVIYGPALLGGEPAAPSPIAADGSLGCGVGVTEGERSGSVVGAVGEGLGDAGVGPGMVVAGAGAAVGSGGTDGLLLAGGGARGTVGDRGASCAARRSGSATRAATAHVAPTPAAARSSRRRAARRRITS
ncbi:hypothetical protein ADK57_04715 [Streptomyces sp. MMG1533]|nr:hypothetical protein ADK57_04715 [Streptomyces sp. MMG1533]